MVLCLCMKDPSFHLYLQADSTSLDGTKNHLLVMEPSTNTMLSGPNAPTEASLEDWLKEHPTFHVVMPSAMPTSRFYG